MPPGRRRISHLPVLFALLGLVVLASGWSGRPEDRRGPHSEEELRSFGDTIQGLRVQFGPYFVTAGRCAGCHGYDSLGVAMVDAEGRSVNVVDDWRSSMMANSARDPFFRAKMEHESLVNPGHAEALQNKCLSCHAPQGMHQERMLQAPPFTMAMLDTSIMGQDGVSCLSCHMQEPTSAGHHFSGDLQFDSAQVYGPYPDSTIISSIMEFFVQFRPSFGEHIVDGRACAGCHTLITETVDLSGEYVGTRFVEQATWQEWKNSDYPAQDINCRSCHLPRIDDPVVLASEYTFLQGHSPFGKHELVGGNTFMLRLMKDHLEELRIPATRTQFDSTIARSGRLLRSSIDLVLQATERTSDTLFVDVELRNNAGHKFPSGYPSRRAFVQFIAISAEGDTLLQSGRWDETWELIGHDDTYEPHQDEIFRNDQVQIYEMVMADVEGGVTTVLERAAQPIKDNRIPPIGFTTWHPSYDTTLIAGVPGTDPDFNRWNGTEGSGADIVHFHVPLQGRTGPIEVQARLYYQPVPPRWNAEMFAFQGTAIDAFRQMYEQQDGTPELVAADTLTDTPNSIRTVAGRGPLVMPNPTSDGSARISGDDHLVVRVFNAAGQEVMPAKQLRHTERTIRLPDGPGTYLLRLEDAQGSRVVRVVRVRP